MDVGVVSSIVSVIALAVSAYSVFYTVRSNTKHFEFSETYFKDIVTWHSDVIGAMVYMRHILYDNETFKKEKISVLAKISSLIETGRFYFPNIDLGDGYGKEKPIAYQGYRNLVLDFVVFFYDVSKNENALEYIDHLKWLERNFTSYVFEFIDPKKQGDARREMMRLYASEEMRFEDFIRKDTSALDRFYALQR